MPENEINEWHLRMLSREVEDSETLKSIHPLQSIKEKSCSQPSLGKKVRSKYVDLHAFAVAIAPESILSG